MKSSAVLGLVLFLLIACGSASAGGWRSQPFRFHSSQAAPQPQPPAGMPNFYQPPRSIDDKEWWKPHPYFQSNGQGFGYPTRPVRPYWTEPERR